MTSRWMIGGLVAGAVCLAVLTAPAMANECHDACIAKLEQADDTQVDRQAEHAKPLNAINEDGLFASPHLKVFKHPVFA